MIFDSLKHIECYQKIHPNLYRGLQLLREDFSGVPEGRYEVDGDRLYYMIQSYTTQPDNTLPEAHKKYADIQCVLSGSEVIAVGRLEEMQEVEAHPERDLWLYHGKLDRLVLTPGRFILLLPQDAHAAAIALDQPGPCHKVVIKVQID